MYLVDNAGQVAWSDLQHSDILINDEIHFYQLYYEI